METKLDNNKRNPSARKLSSPLGAVNVTVAAQEALNPADIVTAITLHSRTDWGDVSRRDWKRNDFAAQHGHQVRSAYTAANGRTFLVITAADRSATTVLLPEEE